VIGVLQIWWQPFASAHTATKGGAGRFSKTHRRFAPLKIGKASVAVMKDLAVEPSTEMEHNDAHHPHSHRGSCRPAKEIESMKFAPGTNFIWIEPFGK